MNVTIIGTGNMGRGIATRLLAGGHGVTLLDRDGAKAEALAGELGGSAGAGTVGDRIPDEGVVLAGPYEAAAPLVRQYGGGRPGEGGGGNPQTVELGALRVGERPARGRG